MPTDEQIWDFRERDQSSKAGKYYINGQCLDCDLCRETAPTVFRRNDDECTSYIYKQPETKEEILLTEEALECCCVLAIQNDGLIFDWESHPPMKRYSTLSKAEKEIRSEEENKIQRHDKPISQCCKNHNRPWWKFWA